MAAGGYVKIYSNDGTTLLFTSTNSYSVADTMTVTETGVTLTNDTYTYSGTKKFLGVSKNVNATEATTYSVGTSNAMGDFTFYIVEAVAEPTLTFDLTTLDLPEGTHNISVIGKADGYKASAASTGAAFVVEASKVTLEAGTYVGNDMINLVGAQGEVIIQGDYPIAFSSNNTSFNKMSVQSSDSRYMLVLYDTTQVYSLDVVFGDYAWTNDNYKTITLETAQEVDETFGTWFNSNFTKQPDTVTIEAGTYVVNSNFSTSSSLTEGTEYTINFTSNNTSFTYISFLAGFGLDMYYDDVMIYYAHTDDGLNWEYRWVNDNYKTITISTPQSVSPEFGEWFNSNFEKQLPTPRIDLSGNYSGYIDISYANGYIWGDLMDSTLANGTFTTSEGETVNMGKYTDSKIVYLTDGNAKANVTYNSASVTQTTSIYNQVYTCNLIHQVGGND